MTDELRCTVDGGVATITINRPDKRNALNSAVLEGLHGSFDRLDADPSVRVAVVRGEGRAFCSGMDLDELGRRQSEEADPETGVTRVLQRIERSRLATIAMIQGAAYAGGCELALHCDLRVAADVARFAMPLARIGLVVPFALGQKLVEILGPALTRQILLTAEPIEARRAYEVGLVHQLVPLADLEKATYDLARTIAGHAPLSLAGMKATIARAVSLREGIEHADLDAVAAQARKSQDAREGVRAMLEKRPPVFRGQ